MIERNHYGWTPYFYRCKFTILRCAEAKTCLYPAYLVVLRLALVIIRRVENPGPRRKILRIWPVPENPRVRTFAISVYGSLVCFSDGRVGKIARRTLSETEQASHLRIIYVSGFFTCIRKRFVSEFNIRLVWYTVGGSVL